MQGRPAAYEACLYEVRGSRKGVADGLDVMTLGVLSADVSEEHT